MLWAAMFVLVISACNDDEETTTAVVVTSASSSGSTAVTGTPIVSGSINSVSLAASTTQNFQFTTTTATRYPIYLYRTLQSNTLDFTSISPVQGSGCGSGTNAEWICNFVPSSPGRKHDLRVLFGLTGERSQCGDKPDPHPVSGQYAGRLGDVTGGTDSRHCA